MMMMMMMNKWIWLKSHFLNLLLNSRKRVQLSLWSNLPTLDSGAGWGQVNAINYESETIHALTIANTAMTTIIRKPLNSLLNGSMNRNCPESAVLTRDSSPRSCENKGQCSPISLQAIKKYQELNHGISKIENF